MKVGGLFRKEVSELSVVDILPYLKSEIIEGEKKERTSALGRSQGVLARRKCLTRHPSSGGGISWHQVGDKGARVRILSDHQKRKENQQVQHYNRR